MSCVKVGRDDFAGSFAMLVGNPCPVAETARLMREATQSRPRTKPPEERRDELMNAAQNLFIEHGVGQTTIEQITAAADVAKGTFYLYFSSKEDVLAALRQRYVQGLLAAIKSAVDATPEGDWQGKLATWAKASIAGYLDAILLHDIVFYESRPTGRRGLVDNVIIDHLRQLLEAGMAAGAWSIDDPHFTAVFLFNGFHGIADDASSREKRVARGLLAAKMQRACFRAVGLSFA
jgi:AcrR family transcriptional regulator